MRMIWLFFGAVSVAAGFTGVFLPVLPTVPFLLLAAFFFGKSSPRAHKWLLAHRLFGPPIRDWHERGAISRKSKILSAASMIAVFVVSIWIQVPVFIILIQIVALLSVSVFIWTRPDT